MKQILISGLMLAAAGIVNTAAPASPNRPLPRALTATHKNFIPARQARHFAPAKVQETNAETVFFESFEQWSIGSDDIEWLPEGWTAQRQASLADGFSWHPDYRQNSAYPAPANGQFYFMINGNTDQDEWLITPQIEIGQDMDLTYYLYYQPFWLFSTENIDWDTYDYNGDKIIVSDFQVYINEEGNEDWIKIQDIAELYKDYSLYELLMSVPTDMERLTVGLADYAGKKVRLGFRYTSIEGDSMFFDAVRVGISQLEDVSYALPATTFYWGYNSAFEGMTTDIAQVPVFSPVNFVNTSGEDATYEWNYVDPETGEPATSDDQTDLVLTYQPDYSSEETIMNNLHEAPVLVASAPGKAGTEYKAPVVIQAGGTSMFKNKEGKTEQLCVFPFPKNTADLGRITVTDYKNGSWAVPVFGRDVNSDKYWYSYTAGNDEDASPETCYNHLLGIANIYMPEIGSKIVVNGINAYGYGLISPDAELKFSIYGLKAIYDDEGDLLGVSSDPGDFITIASKTISGAEIIYHDGQTDQKDNIGLPFMFDAPVVVEATEECPYFFFMLEGFHSDKVEYFAPLQTRAKLPGNIGLGYMMSKIDFQAASGRPAYYSVKPLIYLDEDENAVQPMSAFAFGLIADFPWLTCDTESVSISAEESEVKIALGSYYDGSMLTVEAPEGLVAEVAGRYNECELTISRAADTSDAVEGTVTVKGPAVEIAVEVKADAKTSITNILAPQIDATEVYDLFGRRADKSARGLYIVKHNDGLVSKQVTVK